MLWRKKKQANENKKRKKLALLSQSETWQKHYNYQKWIKWNDAKNQALQNPQRSDQYIRFHVFFSLVGRKGQAMELKCVILQKVF